MEFSEAAHGPWCNTKTFPTRCKHCGQRIFYFTCDHGCKVFFDPPLGPPWPLHRCVGFLATSFGKDVVERGMAVMMMSPGIDRGYTEQVQAAAKPRTQPLQPQILRQDPYEGAKADELGIVREIILDINPYDQFSVPETTMGAAMLGILGKDKFVQVTIHTAPLAGEDNSSFTFLVSRRLFDKKGPIKEDVVSCKLRGVKIGNNDPIWVCDELMGVFD